MKISVVTVSYNAIDLIEDTIKSVAAQTYPDVEYIVIDGASKDGTKELINRHSEKISYWVSEPDKGIYDAMNKGIIMAAGDYINFMNAGDCFASDDVIEKFVESLQEGATVVYGDTLQLRPDGLKLSKALPCKFLSHKGILCHQSAFISLPYHKSHLFDLNYKILADFNFFFNAYNKDHKIFQQVDFTISKFDMTDCGLSKANYEKNYSEYRIILKGHVSPFYMLWLRVREKLGKLKRHWS